MAGSLCTAREQGPRALWPACLLPSSLGQPQPTGASGAAGSRTDSKGNDLRLTMHATCHSSQSLGPPTDTTGARSREHTPMPSPTAVGSELCRVGSCPFPLCCGENSPPPSLTAGDSSTSLPSERVEGWPPEEASTWDGGHGPVGTKGLWAVKEESEILLGMGCP